jgi:V/A-type H+-transporting ATPase subunit K
MISELVSIFGAFLAILVPGIGSGYAMQKIGELSESLLGENSRKDFFTNSLIFSVLAETPTIYGLLIAILVIMKLPKDILLAYGTLLASLSVAIPGVAAAYAIGLVSQAALVAIHEKKSLFGKTLILAALPEAIAIYGLIIALLILSATGTFGTPKIKNIDDIGKLAIATLIIALSGIIALFIGRIATSAVKSLVKDEGAFTQALIIAVLPESIAIYALLVAVLIINNARLL